MGSPHQKKLLRSVSKYFQDLKILVPGQRILVALSGGKDSMTLLSILSKLQSEFEFKVMAAYVDHKTRKETELEATALEAFCKKMNIPFTIGKISPKEKPKNSSPEEWLRNERYRILERIRINTDSNWVATGHHANDNAETVMLRFIQGAGIAGLSGIPPIRGNIIRPILHISRADIDQYVIEEGLPYVEDRTNNDTSVPRNFIRHSILREWNKEFPEVIDGINTSIRNIKDVKEAIRFLENSYIEKLILIEPGTWSMNKDWFDELPIYLRLKLIFRCISNEYGIRRDIWIRIKEFLENSSTGNLLNLFEDWTLVNDRKNWILTQNFSPEKQSLKVNSGAVYKCGNNLFTAKREKPGSGFDRSSEIELVDEDSINIDSLELRPWKHGDSFIPLGMKTEKKLSDFLIDEKVSRWQKERQYVLTSNNEIIWVCGLRISEKVKITSKTKKVLRLSWNKRN